MHRRKALQYLSALPVTAAMPACAPPGSSKEPSRFKPDGGLSRMGELYRGAGT